MLVLNTLATVLLYFQLVVWGLKLGESNPIPVRSSMLCRLEFASDFLAWCIVSCCGAGAPCIQTSSSFWWSASLHTFISSSSKLNGLKKPVKSVSSILSLWMAFIWPFYLNKHIVFCAIGMLQIAYFYSNTFITIWSQSGEGPGGDNLAQSRVFPVRQEQIIGKFTEHCTLSSCIWQWCWIE